MNCNFHEHVVIGTKWVVVNKGKALNPRIKARLVAKEFRTKDGADELFSGTPGLAGVRFVLSDLATNNRGGRCEGSISLRSALS